MTKQDFLDKLYQMTINGVISWRRNGTQWITDTEDDTYKVILMQSLITIKSHLNGDIRNLEIKLNSEENKIYQFLNEENYFDEVINFFEKN